MELHLVVKSIVWRHGVIFMILPRRLGKVLQDVFYLNLKSTLDSTGIVVVEYIIFLELKTNFYLFICLLFYY